MGWKKCSPKYASENGELLFIFKKKKEEIIFADD